MSWKDHKNQLKQCPGEQVIGWEFILNRMGTHKKASDRWDLYLKKNPNTSLVVVERTEWNKERERTRGTSSGVAYLGHWLPSIPNFPALFKCQVLLSWEHLLWKSVLAGCWSGEFVLWWGLYSFSHFSFYLFIFSLSYPSIHLSILPSIPQIMDSPFVERDMQINKNDTLQ